MIKKLYNSYNGTAVDIHNIILSKGILLDTEAELDEGIAGEISNGDTGYKIRVNRDDPEDWKRFTMAHELGHYVFHRNLIGVGVDDNRLYFSTNEGNYSKNDNVTEVHELQAHIFACNVLMPLNPLRAYISRYVQDKDNMQQPQDHFQVPFDVIKWWLSLNAPKNVPEKESRSESATAK